MIKSIYRNFFVLENRIVARVDQLMSLCDALEAGLLRSQAESERLMEAVVGGCWQASTFVADYFIYYK